MLGFYTSHTGVYFAGLLLKTRAMAQDGGIGVMLVILVVAVIVVALVLAITKFRTGLKHLKKVLHNFDILYAGCIHPVEGLGCVASFPGKFAEGWNKVVRLGGKKSSSGRCTSADPTNEGQPSRRMSDHMHIYGHRTARDGASEGSDPEPEEERAQLSVACVFFTPRKWASCEGNSCVLSNSYFHAFPPAAPSATDAQTHPSLENMVSTPTPASVGATTCTASPSAGGARCTYIENYMDMDIGLDT
jgi:hypothetical protein